MNASQACDLVLAIKKQCLLDYGFTIGERDPRLNTACAGRYMVVDTTDGSKWYIVGDNLENLICAGFDYIVGSDT